MTAVTAATTAAHPPAPARDRAVDLVRAACVVCVVTLHALMVGVTVSSAGPSFVNAADDASWIVPVSWLLQVMPLFFVIGGFSGATALRRMRGRGQDATAFVAGRVRRLLLPAAVTIGSAGAVLAVLTTLGISPDLVRLAGFRYGQPLWFLGVFLACQALLPALLRCHDRAPLRTLGALAAAAVAVDVMRQVSGIEVIGFVNLAFVWLALQQVGLFLADGSIDRLAVRTRVLAAAGAVSLLAAAIVAGVYPPDLVAAINPPTTALLLVGIAHTALFSLGRGMLDRFAARPAPAAFTRFLSGRAMTVYLWHMPVLLAMAGITALVAMLCGIPLPTPGSGGWWASRPLWLAVAFAGTLVVTMSLARFEMRTAPAPDRGIARVGTSVVVGVSAVALLLVAATGPGTAAIAAAGLLGALRLSARPVTGASLPAIPATAAPQSIM
ncbi:acyltransferase family protein [Microbacterium mangrovi]|uniref:acyltransferase family protein n=1 Tax=Microbacterium mangrovi TaxID=1348253 RepID=UPI00068F4F41|nr:acyltransferase [Microbacterium mangrovi]